MFLVLCNVLLFKNRTANNVSKFIVCCPKVIPTKNSPSRLVQNDKTKENQNEIKPKKQYARREAG